MLPPQLNAADRRLFQYTGVARPDELGVVQIGYSPERIKRTRQLAESINKTVSALKNHPPLPALKTNLKSPRC